MGLEHELTYDFDTEQSQARYDSRLLSKALQDHRSSPEKRSTPCFTSHSKYEHGQKVMRADPCEMCLCVDGEIFCWWKKCVHRKWRKEIQKEKRQKIPHNVRRQMLKKSSEKFKMIKFIPKRVLSFPHHLPSILHFDYNSNETEPEIASSASITSHRKNLIKTERRYHQEPSIPDNEFFDDTRSTDSDQTSRDQENKNKIKHPPAPAEDNVELNLYRQEKLINSNGTFVESENQMNYPNNELQKREHQSTNHNIIASGTNTQQNVEDKSWHRPPQKQETEKIQFVDVPLAKHYIITSSGSIENTDILASESVLSQFRNEFKVVSSSSSSAGDDDTKGDTIMASNSNVKVSEADNESSKPLSSPQLMMQGHSNLPYVPDALPSQSAPTFQASQQIATTATTVDTSPEPTHRAQQECVVMGVSYKIGTILPQETGNCLQCICIEGINENDAPRVTCSPHNCPPLVLPDLFDTTGY